MRPSYTDHNQEISPCDPEDHLEQMVPLQPACWQGFTVCHQSDFSCSSLIKYCWGGMSKILWWWERRRGHPKPPSSRMILSLKIPILYSLFWKNTFALVPELSKWVRQGTADNSHSWEVVPLRIITQTECDTTEKMTGRGWRMQGRRKLEWKQTNETSLWQLLSHTGRVFHWSTASGVAWFWCLLFPTPTPCCWRPPCCYPET